MPRTTQIHPTGVGFNPRNASSNAASSTVPADRLARFLRQRHPTKTAAHVAARCPGVSAAAVERMFQRRALPSCLAFGRMIAGYGPELLGAVLGSELGSDLGECSDDAPQSIEPNGANHP